MSIDGRLHKLMPVLSARERAVLVLRSLKDKTPEDPSWRHTMPLSQVTEFNRYIDLMNACNIQVSYMITVIEKEIDKLELLCGWWFCLLLWQVNLAEIDFAASVVAREAVTASEHRRLVERDGAAFVPVQLLARELAEYRRDWSDDDLEPLPGWQDELVLKDAAWQRHLARAEADLRQAAKDGLVESRGPGKKLTLRSASFDALLERPARAYPEWAGGYDVMPDERQAQVQADRTTLANLRDAIQRTPLQRSTTRPEPNASLANMLAGLVEQMMTVMAVRWLDIGELEVVLGEVAEDFGEDPLKPVLRASLEQSKQRLLAVHGQLKAHNKVLTLPEPTQDGLASLREVVNRRRDW
jgi:hypothetical protein